MKIDPSPVKPGDIVAGKYRVDRIIGQGGMGVVVAATHQELREVRAIKFLLPSSLKSDDSVERFRREARTVLKLKSEHVARVLDIGKTDGGAPFMVMEYLEGHDLGEALRRRGSMPLDTAVSYVLQAMDAVAEAHAKGIIHRDLKPANLFLTTLPSGRSCVKVLDFGISKHPKETVQDIDMTKTHTVLGSPQYMSPEQMRASRDVDQRTDIWSLGVILYQLTTGKLPFRGRSSTEIIALMFSTTPEVPSTFAPHLPGRFDDVVMRCLCLEAADRYTTVAELAAALSPFAPPSATYMIERIARYSNAEARKAAGPSLSPADGVSEEPLTPVPRGVADWDTPVGSTSGQTLQETISSAPTNVMHLGSRTEVMESAMPRLVPPGMENVRVESPSSSAPTKVLLPGSTVDLSLSSAPTKVLEALPKDYLPSKTEVMVQPPRPSLGQPSASSGSVDQTWSGGATAIWQNRPSNVYVWFFVGAILVGFLIVVLLFLFL